MDTKLISRLFHEQRYEAPISSNRWDSPLFLALKVGFTIFSILHNLAENPGFFSDPTLALENSSHYVEIRNNMLINICYLYEAPVSRHSLHQIVPNL